MIIFGLIKSLLIILLFFLVVFGYFSIRDKSGNLISHSQCRPLRRSLDHSHDSLDGSLRNSDFPKACPDCHAVDYGFNLYCLLLLLLFYSSTTSCDLLLQFSACAGLR